MTDELVALFGAARLAVDEMARDRTRTFDGTVCCGHCFGRAVEPAPIPHAATCPEENLRLATAEAALRYAPPARPTLPISPTPSADSDGSFSARSGALRRSA